MHLALLKQFGMREKKENETPARTHEDYKKQASSHFSVFHPACKHTLSVATDIDTAWVGFVTHRVEMNLLFFLVTVKVSVLQGSELDAPLFFSSGSPTLSLLSPLHRCFLFHLYFNLSPTPSPLAVVVCGLQGGCVSAGPLPVWAVRSGLRWVLPGQGPLLHLGRTCLQPLYADRAQVGRTYQLYADPDSTDNITADWVSPYGLNLFYYEKNQCGINLPKFDLNHICW